MEEQQNIFGERLKQCRTKKNITQAALAEAVGVSANTIIAYEKGAQSPSVDTAIKMAVFLSASVNWLCGGNDDFCSIDWAPLYEYKKKSSKMYAVYASGVMDKETYDFWNERQMKLLDVPIRIKRNDE